MIYEFKPYTSCPPKTDPNFIATSKGGYSHCIVRDKKTGYTLPNCVAYAHGEWLHLLTQAVGLEKAKQYESELCRNNAEYYYAHDDEFARSRMPVLGSIIVWEGKGKLAGHVAVVTEIKDNGDIVVQASNYSGTKFYTASYKKSNGFKINDNYTFLGFIDPPVTFGKFVTVPVERNSKLDQVKVSIDNLNVRQNVYTYITFKKHGKGTDAPRIGYAAPGYYNVYKTAKDATFTWYKINEEDDLWIAQVNGVEFLENNLAKYEVTAQVPLLKLGKVEMFLKSEDIEYEVKQL